MKVQFPGNGSILSILLYLITDNAGSGEWDDDSAEFVSDLTKNLSTFRDKVTMVFRFDGHLLLDHIILKGQIKKVVKNDF